MRWFYLSWAGKAGRVGRWVVGVKVDRPIVLKVLDGNEAVGDGWEAPSRAIPLIAPKAAFPQVKFENSRHSRNSGRTATTWSPVSKFSSRREDVTHYVSRRQEMLLRLLVAVQRRGHGPGGRRGRHRSRGGRYEADVI